MTTKPQLAIALALFASTAAPVAAQNALTAQRVEAIVQSAAEKFAATGLAVAVIQDGKVLVESAHGERAAGKPMTATSLCNIASCTKAFTAAAIMMLVEQDKLALDDRVVEHLPEFRMSDPWITANMTIRDLLCHRCGLVTFAGDLLWYASDYDDAEVIRRMAKLPIEQPFRAKYGYQNLMYLVAGAIVERKSGKSWEQFVQDHLLTPLGMTASRPDAQSLPADAERAMPHIDGEQIPDHEFQACKPAASMYSSVRELTAWMRMLLAGGKADGKQVLSPRSLGAMWRPHTSVANRGTGAGTEDFYSYGLGWFLDVRSGKKLVEHDGGMPGFLSKVSLMPVDGFGFCILNNSNDGILNEALKRAILGEREGADGMKVIAQIAAIKKRIDRSHEQEVRAREGKRREGTRPSRELADFAGRYTDEIYGSAEVTLENGELSFVMLPSKRRLFGKMKHWHDDTFRIDFPDKFLPFALVRFEFEPNGDLRGLRIDCPIADFDFGALDFRRD